MQTVTQAYMDGVLEGRKTYREEGMENAQAHIDNLRETKKLFGSHSPVGQMIRGELDFWEHKMRNYK